VKRKTVGGGGGGRKRLPINAETMVKTPKSEWKSSNIF
jgi:hypothetical protein